MEIRAARRAEAQALRELTRRAYACYVERLGRWPRPVEDDFEARVRAGQAWVAEENGSIVGLIVLEDAEDHVFVDNVAVDPRAHGRGFGGALLAFAEQRARGRAVAEVRLHTNVKMTENRAMYPRLGYVERERVTVGGFERVLFVKRV